MPDGLNINKTFSAIEQAIAICQKRHATIASNISNLETPGYRAKDVDFQSALSQAMGSNQNVDLATTHPGHISGGGGSSEQRIESFEDQGEWNGYNWVSIDKEMNRLTENNLLYRTSVEILIRKIALLREVIKEGGR